MPQGIAINNMLRQLVRAFGIAFMNTYVARQYAEHRTQLLNYITPDSPEAVACFAATTNALTSKGMDAAQEHHVGFEYAGWDCIEAGLYPFLPGYIPDCRDLLYMRVTIDVLCKENMHLASTAAIKEAAEHAH